MLLKQLIAFILAEVFSVSSEVQKKKAEEYTVYPGKHRQE
jgi:hypothetical protein